MKKRCLLMILLISLGAKDLWAQNAVPVQYEMHYKKVCMGEITEDYKFFVFRAKAYPLYNLLGTTFIPIKYLEAMGAQIQKKDDCTYVTFKETYQQKELQRLSVIDKFAYSNEESVYIENLKTYSIKVSEEVLIPVEALNIKFDIRPYKSIYLAEEKFGSVNQYIGIDEETVCNLSEHMLRVSLMHMFWDGHKYIEDYEQEFLLEPYQKRKKHYLNITKPLNHITTIVLSVNGLQKNEVYHQYYGQKNESFFKRYSRELKREKLELLFPAYHIKGTLKQDIGKYNKGDQIEIWRAEKRSYYVAKTEEGKNIMIPWNSIIVEGDKGVWRKEASSEDIEDYVNIKELTSKTDYLIWTDLYRQKTYILKGTRGNWKLQKVFLCSSGRNTFPTPSGIFKLQYTIPYFGLQKNYRCKNAVVFFRDYMFHSILFDSTGKYVKEGKYQLGLRVSHGCVRLSEEDSAWIYENIPMETTVWIR